MFFSRSAEKKRIDYVLVYGKDTKEDLKKDEKRKEFEEGLLAAGIELEEEDIEVSFKYNTFVPTGNTVTVKGKGKGWV